jgi:ankyrin repeat protein
MELLLAKGAEVNAKDSEGVAPLQWAAICGHRDIAELLLTNGAEVNARNDKGRMALHWAANIARRDVVELLLSNGAEVNARDNEGKTALQEAVSGQVGVRAEKYKGIAELLRQHGGCE